jgi:hypothetical protein
MRLVKRRDEVSTHVFSFTTNNIIDPRINLEEAFGIE